jgi:hypothetical protein
MPLLSLFRQSIFDLRFCLGETLQNQQGVSVTLSCRECPWSRIGVRRDKAELARSFGRTIDAPDDKCIGVAILKHLHIDRVWLSSSVHGISARRPLAKRRCSYERVVTKHNLISRSLLHVAVSAEMRHSPGSFEQAFFSCCLLPRAKCDCRHPSDQQQTQKNSSLHVTVPLFQVDDHSRGTPKCFRKRSIATWKSNGICSIPSCRRSSCGDFA